MNFPLPWASHTGPVSRVNAWRDTRIKLAFVTEFSIEGKIARFYGPKLPIQSGEHVVVVGREYDGELDACFVGRPQHRKLYRGHPALPGFLAAAVLLVVGLGLLRMAALLGLSLIALAFLTTVLSVAWNEGEHLARRLMKAYQRPD